MPLKDRDARRAYHREYMRNWYQSHRELQIERATRVNRRAREAARDYVNELKSSPCVDCGGRFPPFVMDFDHVRGEKVGILSRLSGGRMAWSKVLNEIAKCEVVCSNCHRIRTHLRSTGVAVRANELLARLGPGYVSIVVY